MYTVNVGELHLYGTRGSVIPIVGELYILVPVMKFQKLCRKLWRFL
jgi:hypothetical protein